MEAFKTDRKIFKIALLVSLGCVLQISESMIPHPIPGLRLGLANMLTLTAMVVLGFKDALMVATLRAVLGSFIMGTFMSPTFILSFCGSVASTLIMGLLFWLTGIHHRFRMSIIGISIVGAFTFNMVQLYLAYLLLVKHNGIFVFFPWLSYGAVATGWVVGIVAGRVCMGLRDITHQHLSKFPVSSDVAVFTKTFVPGNSFVHRVPGVVKISGVFAAALAILFFNDFRVYLALFSFLGALTIASRTPLLFMLSRIKKFAFLIVLSFLLPVFFNTGTQVAATIGQFKITYEGLGTGTLFAARLLFLILSSSLLVRTTHPDQMTQGLSQFLSPLQRLGLPTAKIAAVLSVSWTSMPGVWNTVRSRIRTARLKSVKDLRSLIPLLSDLIVSLYLMTEPAGELLKEAHAEEGMNSASPNSGSLKV